MSAASLNELIATYAPARVVNTAMFPLWRRGEDWIREPGELDEKAWFVRDVKSDGTMVVTPVEPDGEDDADPEEPRLDALERRMARLEGHVVRMLAALAGTHAGG